MTGKHWAFAVLMATVLVPDVSEACLFCHGGRRHRMFDRCGTGCGMPCGDPCQSPCFTPPPMPCAQSCLVPQQFTTYRDVPQTCYRQEPVCQMVPVTTCKQVTVDAGCYQQVWVPKLVTQNVPQTVYQQQVSYRTVPVTTMARVPVTETRLVPQMMPMMPSCAAPSCAAPSCAAPMGTMMFSPDAMPMAPAATPTPYGMPNVPGATQSGPVLLPPTSMLMPSAMYNPPTGMGPLIPAPTAEDPRPTQTSAAEEWSTIERRAAMFEKEFGYRPFGGRVQQASYSR